MSLVPSGVSFEQIVDGEVDEMATVFVSRAAMREIVSGYHRELDQEREEHGSD